MLVHGTMPLPYTNACLFYMYRYWGRIINRVYEAMKNYGNRCMYISRYIILTALFASLYIKPLQGHLRQPNKGMGPGPECEAVKDPDRNCYNGNKVYEADFLANKLKESGTMGHTLSVAWGDEEWCQELVTRNPEAQNEMKFRTNCIKIFGNDCCHECIEIGKLFDRMDYTVFPPSNNNGGLGYRLTMDDCLSCIKEEDCEMPIRSTWKEGVGIWRKTFGILSNAINKVSLRDHAPADDRFSINK